MEDSFFDINQFPQEEGLLFLGISMSRIGNAQNAEKCVEYVRHLGNKINKTDGVGALFVYADYLYFHSSEPANILRDRYIDLMLSHKGAFLNALFKDDKSWIKKAFSFSTFGQLMLDNAETFRKTYQKVTELYEQDIMFKKFVDEDVKRAGKNENSVNFILEEITIFYLLGKGKLILNNQFVSGSAKWTLQCYPGKPLASEVFLFQMNPLGLLSPQNKYENCYYDLESKLLYDYTKLDINTFNF